MKIKMVFIAVFLLTFLFGCLFVLPIFQKEKNVQTVAENTVVVKAAPVLTLPKESSDKIVSYAISKNFADSRLLDENYGDEEETEYKYELLQTGQFHGDEVTAKSGEKWFGLFAEKGESFLRETKINVKTVRDEIVDDKRGEKTGKKVSVKEKQNPYFLLNKNPSAKRGKISTIFAGAAFDETNTEESITETRNGFIKNFELGGEKYALRVVKTFNKSLVIRYALVLETDKITQILSVSDSDYLGTLFWIGDLDGDRKPDIFLAPWVKENISQSSLFLSAEAEKNHLVKESAIMETVGC